MICTDPNPTFQMVFDPDPDLDPTSDPTWILLNIFNIKFIFLSSLVSVLSCILWQGKFYLKKVIYIFKLSWPDPEWFFPDPDPAKSFGSDWIRIWIHNAGTLIIQRYLLLGSLENRQKGWRRLSKHTKYVSYDANIT